MEVDCDLELAETVVELKQVVERQKLGRVDEAMPVHEHLQVHVLLVLLVVLVKQHDVEVLLSVPQLILEL